MIYLGLTVGWCSMCLSPCVIIWIFKLAGMSWRCVSNTMHGVKMSRNHLPAGWRKSNSGKPKACRRAFYLTPDLNLRTASEASRNYMFQFARSSWLSSWFTSISIDTVCTVTMKFCILPKSIVQDDTNRTKWKTPNATDGSAQALPTQCCYGAMMPLCCDTLKAVQPSRQLPRKKSHE